MKQHRHRVESEKTRCYLGPVTSETSGRYRQNPAAHGWVTYISYCRCGATRKDNVNGGHIERGPVDERRWRITMAWIKVLEELTDTCSVCGQVACERDLWYAGPEEAFDLDIAVGAVGVYRLSRRCRAGVGAGR